MATRCEATYAVLSDPTTHAAIDGTGWVVGAVDADRLSRVGQVFRMTMYHPAHPSGHYETVNEVTELDAGHSIAWRTGYADAAGDHVFEGWWWRYDLRAETPQLTEVVLTYDWSEVGPGPRSELSFPPFPVDHLERSLRNLDRLCRG